jgi:hypothetical protein
VLRADWRPDDGDVRHAARRAGALCDTTALTFVLCKDCSAVVSRENTGSSSQRGFGCRVPRCDLRGDLKLVKWEERRAPAPVQFGAPGIGGAAAAV